MVPSMHRFGLLVTSLLSVIGIASAAPSIAGVRVDDIYRQLEETRVMTKTIETERREILKDARLKAYSEALKELETLQKTISQAAQQDRLTRERMLREFAMKRDEAVTLQREFEDFRQRRTREINRRMVSETEAILAKIHTKSAEIAAAKGYDLVFDVSGNTNTTIPFVVYAKDPVDLTPDILATFELAPKTDTAASKDR